MSDAPEHDLDDSILAQLEEQIISVQSRVPNNKTLPSPEKNPKFIAKKVASTSSKYPPLEMRASKESSVISAPSKNQGVASVFGSSEAPIAHPTFILSSKNTQKLPGPLAASLKEGQKSQSKKESVQVRFI
jgi:hypothetical protein